LVENSGEIAGETSNENGSFVVKNIQNVHHMNIDAVSLMAQQFWIVEMRCIG